MDLVKLYGGFELPTRRIKQSEIDGLSVGMTKKQVDWVIRNDTGMRVSSPPPGEEVWAYMRYILDSNGRILYEASFYLIFKNDKLIKYCGSKGFAQYINENIGVYAPELMQREQDQPSKRQKEQVGTLRKK